MRADGLCPKHQAGKAMEPTIDFKWRGGTLMISRRMSPLRTAVSLLAITSTCPFIENSVPGQSSAKPRAVNIARSQRSRVWNCSGSRFSIVSSLIAGEARLQQFQDLLVCIAKAGGFSGGGIAA